MSNIGVDFILRARTDSFTRGIASANNTILNLKKSAREFDLGAGFKQLLGVGGIIAGFKLAVDNAQKLRDAAREIGRPIDDATRSVAAYGDALDDLVQGTKNVATETLSFFTRAGEGWGMMINRLRGVSREQEQIAENAARGAAEQEKAADALYKKNLERSKTIGKDIADQESKNAEIGLSKEALRNKLLEERTKLWDDIDKLPENKDPAFNVARNEKQLRATQLTGQIKQLGTDIFNDAEEQRKKKQEEQDKAKKELISNFAPTVEELAKKDVGGFFAGNDPRLKARGILKDEDLARTLFDRGDYKGGLAAAQKAAAARQNLENQTSGTGALTPKAAEDAVHEALKDTNVKLDTLTKAVSGIIKAQK